MIRVAVNGFGTIGKRVADAVSRQDDMKLVGVTKTRPDYEALVALKRGYDIYIPRERERDFIERGVRFRGYIEDLLSRADIVVDATPGGVGARYRGLYEKTGVRAVFQGGEDESVAEISFNALVNYEKALGRRFIRVVSCNTTGLVRLIWAVSRAVPIKRVRAVIVRRGADPKEVGRGPINSLVLDPPEIPSHHAHDVRTVLGDIDIVTTAVATPTTLMHIHSVFIETREDVSRDRVLEALAETPRILLVDSRRTGVRSTSEVIEIARDLGRQRYDIYENIVWRDTVYVGNREVFVVQAIHQEAVVIPENIDAIRASTETERDPVRSIDKTDRSLGIYRGELI